jgi:catechol 2,3-dioxygenase-like lactoylglutathione lyase family enzyme
MQPTIERVLETALYVDDIKRSADFYINVFGFPVIVRDDSRICALDAAGQQVFLLFKKGATLEPLQSSGGTIPPHHGNGNLHFAFAIASDQYDLWKERLIALDISIESEVTWNLGGRSLYFRDPDNHCVELATPGTWKTY